MFVGDFEERIAVDGGVPCQELVEDEPGGVDVGPRTENAHVELFGGHVLRRAVDAAGVGEGELLDGGVFGGAQGFGKPEIEDDDVFVVSFFALDHNVGGLEIAVDDLAAVGFHESAEDLEHVAFGAGE